MKYILDHDFHIHSRLSSCSADPEQTTENILRYAEENGFRKIVLTDHLWDSDVKPPLSAWYAPQNYGHISEALPLPQSENVEFRFGCETELDKDLRLGLSPNNFDKFDFIIIPTTHLHMGEIISKDATVEERTYAYITRLDKLLDFDLPFEKIGIAHLTTPLIANGNRENHLKMLDMISDETFYELFEKVKRKGAGVELNMNPSRYTQNELESVLRPYRTAKKCGCKFYFGSDAHHPQGLREAKARFECIAELLELEESEKFDF